MTSQPRVFYDPAQLRAEIRQAQADGKRVGLVPTMGALHPGHLSLVAQSQKSCDLTVVTIFVNPSQFAPGEDFAKYPRTLDADLQLLSEFDPVWVLVPEVDAMYPPGSTTVVKAPEIALPLEGTFRPIHFDGVATIVLKLFQVAPADAAFFGQKDFQQVRVIEEMVRDLLVPIEIVRCPIIREADGLAMSSRNRYLSPEEREIALSISRSLHEAAQQIAGGEADAQLMRGKIEQALHEAGIGEIDYVSIACPRTLKSVETIEGDVVILVAARVGTTRLIDNVLVPFPVSQ
ncbi:pantoate--beta-alanine ligase [Blastopirellula marina]|uniref:Pantothenate synthetase n=1 Tax=Blastopirellula marina TaxID=124 RepID=A0A2S8FUE9_9BACT|nr:MULTISPECIES: pantoate--beta-alanine ligase [Pirellulaceae]PQO35773.1 pantoate--beta-alanine ligase [Blastopirellula marina]RCS53348.1 pantoate--beta-alanine ligase [Bremerella cremea]